MAETVQIITQLVVDASGSKAGVAEFEASLDRARQAAANAGESVNSFDAVLKRWTGSLAATDPVLRAQVAQQQALQRQMSLNAEAVRLGIATQDAANAQLDRVNQKYGAYVQSAEAAAEGQSKFGQVVEFTRGQVAGFIGVLTVDRIIGFGKQLVDNAAAIKAQADQAGVSIPALQAYQAVLQANGVSADQADQLLTRLTQSIGDALRQAGPARDGFNQLGISVATLKGGAEETLPAMARALLAIPDPTRRAALEVDEFGRSGQRLESALRALTDPTSTLIEKETALGQVLGTDLVNQADAANTELDKTWKRLKNDLTPAAVTLTGALADLIEKYRELGTAAYGPDQSAIPASPGAPKTGLGFFGSGGVFGHRVAPPTAGPANDNSGTYATTALDEYIAKQKLSASIAGQGPVAQAETNALIEAANVKLASGAGLSAQQLAHFQNSDGTMRKFVTSTSEAVDVLGQATAHEVQGLAATIARGQQWNKVKETFEGYLAGLNEEARVAGESTAQRQTELGVIKAAQVAQAAAGVQEKDRVQTYAQAVDKLGQQKTQEVEIAATARQTAAFHKDIADQVTLANVAAANGRDDRDLALAVAQKQLLLGRQLTDEERQQLALIQQQTDSARLRDYTDQLKDEASLAGLSADERERQQAVLEAIRLTHGKLTDQQRSEIDGVIATRQETERWRDVVNGVATPCEEYPAGFVEKPQVARDIKNKLQEIFT
jgi:hypothetical protein